MESGWGVTGLYLSSFKFNSLVSPKSRIDQFLKSDSSDLEKKSFQRRRVNKMDIDPSVLAQLPRSIREEILAAVTTTSSSSSSSRSSSNNNKTLSRKRKSKPRTIESMMMKSSSSSATTKTKNSKRFESLDRAKLDVDVLMALPENIRAEILDSLDNNDDDNKTSKKKKKRMKLDSWIQRN